MADNLTTTTTVSTIPSGTVIATDDAGAGGHVQIVKLAISTDGSATAIPAEATNGLDVDVTRVIPGTSATHLGKAIDSAAGATDTGVAALVVRDDALGALTPAEGDYVTLRVDANGALWTHDDALDAALGGSELQVDVVGALPAGSNLIGDVGIQGRATGGLSIFRSIDLDESEEEVKATAGTLYSVYAFNATAAVLYLKFYNATAASTTVGTTTPVLTLPIPANNDTDGAGFVWSVPQGLAFDTAISAAVTTGVADADTGAPAANAAIVNLGYK